MWGPDRRWVPDGARCGMPEDMDHRHVTFRLTSEFVIRNAILTPAEVKCGYDQQWLSAADVVAIATAGAVAAPEGMAAVDELSLLLSDELDRVHEVVKGLAPDPARVWIYLATAWVVQHPADFGGTPLETIDELYCDFEHPVEMADFITYMPIPPGASPGLDGAWERLHAFLDDGASTFHSALRPASPV